MAINQYVENEKKYFEVYVNGFDARGRRVQRRKRGIETRRKADVAEFEFKRELAKLRDEKVSYLWSEWFEECVDRIRLTYRPSTFENYDKLLRKWINPSWNRLELIQITKAKVHATIFEEVDPGLTPWTRRTLLKMARKIFQMAIEEGCLDRNPCVGIRVTVPEVDQKVLTNAETEKFLREAKLADHRFFPIWFMALKTGMRSGELMAICWSDVDFDARTISVSKQWSRKTGFGPTKTQRSRVVPVSEDLLAFLKEQKLKTGKEEFVLTHFPEWGIGDQSRVTREFCDAIGVTSIKFHDLRATFITNLLARGAPLAQVMAVVGHTQLKTTNAYLRKAGVDVQGVTERLGYKMPEVNEKAKILLFGAKENG